MTSYLVVVREKETFGLGAHVFTIIWMEIAQGKVDGRPFEIRTTTKVFFFHMVLNFLNVGYKRLRHILPWDAGTIKFIGEVRVMWTHDIVECHITIPIGEHYLCWKGRAGGEHLRVRE